MKRCPECRREYDVTMTFCLDDGAELLYGPAESEPPAGGQYVDEPQTAILRSTAAPGEAPTRAQIHTSEQTAVPPSGIADVARPRGFDKRLLFATLALAVIVLGGFFGYKYFSPTKQIESIAVMPFVNDSGNPEVEYLSDGMTETLIGSLSQLPNLNVKARSSVFRYKGKEIDANTIGKELKVQAILNGRVVQRGDQLTLSLELIDAQTENVIWSDKYERKQADLVSLQNEIARNVSQKLKTKLSGIDEQTVVKNSTANTEAYQLYLMGRYHYNKFTDDGYRKGIEYFEQATSADPNYALAYTGLADCYFGLSDQFEPPNDVMPKARAAAEKALALDDGLAEAHASLGLVKMFYDLNWTEAEAEFRRAVELDPNYANAHLFYSRLLVASGRFDEAVKESEISVHLEPLSPNNNAYLGYVLMFAGRRAEAVAQLNKAIELDDNIAIVHHHAGSVYQAMGRLDAAIAEYERAFTLNRNARYLMALGNAYGAAGQREKALRVLSDLVEMKEERYVSSYFLAVVHAGLNNKDQAFALLDKAFEEHADSVAGMKISVFLGNLHSDPRYAALVRRLNLPQ